MNARSRPAVRTRVLAHNERAPRGQAGPSELVCSVIIGWTPRDEWERLVRGEGCPLCEDMERRMANDHIDADGRTISPLDASVLRLCADQFTPGYCVVISTRHVAEPYDLPALERGVFFADVLRAGKAVQQALGSIKMNYLILGNEQPHLHCHLVPRYYGDPAPGRPLLPGDPVHADADTCVERVNLIRAAL
jgi:diadenosine tetraphosphate (Ap4A) HIT family hydrolase